jgi:FlaA1/EpsC-like NDP-sugar epimerase
MEGSMSSAGDGQEPTDVRPAVAFLIRWRTLLIVAVAVAISVASYWAAFALRFDFRIPPDYQGTALTTLPVLLLCKAIGFWYARLYSGWWRHISMGDVRDIVRGSALGSILFFIAIVAVRGLTLFPRSIFLLDFGIATGAIAGIRLALRFLRERTERGPRRRIDNIALVVGAGSAGIRLREEIDRYQQGHTAVAGFVDDDPRKVGLRIGGCPVLGTIDEIPHLVGRHDVTKIMIAIPSARWELRRRIVERSREAGVSCQVLPSLGEIVAGRFLYSQLRQVGVNDLLSREPVDLGASIVRDLVDKKTILITGAAGSIGSELCRQVAACDPERLVLFDRHENGVFELESELARRMSGTKITAILGDVLFADQLAHVFSTYQPDIVFHAAAYKHVALAEKNPLETIRNNVLGTRNLVDISVETGVSKFVLVSTDKAVRPTSVMGLTKAVSERIVQSARGQEGRFIAVRFGNVLASTGSVVPIFRDQIASGGPVTVTHPEATRFFMTIPEAVQLILRAATLDVEAEIILLEMGEPIKIADLARNMIELSGLQPDEDIEIQYIGLRPGEKLHEDLVHPDEKVTTTQYRDLKLLHGTGIFSDLARHMDAIEQTLEAGELRATFERLTAIVPDYQASETIIDRIEAERTRSMVRT